MCGISGIYAPKSSHLPTLMQLENMADALIHRGPDDVGIYCQNELGLAFRRLSIMDIAGGHQPMQSVDSQQIMICNGEIFNHRELRHELTQKEHLFLTHCDVEVILPLYKIYGRELLTHLNGQFALALFDFPEKMLLLARDPLGIAPLFYSVVDGTLLFASEIKALLTHPLISRAVDLTGLDQIITLPGTVSPRTCFAGISSLKPGHWMTMDANGDIKTGCYWDFNYPTQPDPLIKTENDGIEALENVLKRAVKRRLDADVPVGFYLSGGLDSSLIGALIHDLGAVKNRHAFSIQFNQREIDERHYQQLMAQTIGATHEQIVFDWPQIANSLATIIYHSETPLKESYNTCSLALSQAVKNHGYKVVLTGEGADELFGGYVGYRLANQRQPIDEYDLNTLMENEVRMQMWGDENFFYERNYLELRELKAAIYAPELAQQLGAFDCTQKRLIDGNQISNRHPLHRRSYVDAKCRMADHLLADHGDRMAFAASIEARYPFLDLEVIDCVKRIPPAFLVKQMEEKSLLKQLAAKYIPQAILKREKFSFVAPGSPYLLRQNIEWVNDLLSYERIKTQGYFNPDAIERLKKQYSQPDFYLSQTFEIDWLMIVLTFGLFLEAFKLPNRS